MEKKAHQLPPFFISLIPVIFLMGALFIGVIVYKLSPHIPLIITCGFTILIARFTGVSWKKSLKFMERSVTSTLAAIFILMMVGILISTWIQGGIVPTLIYYGFDLLSVKYFLFSSAVISSIVSLATGSSWSTAGTIGLALMGIGAGLGVPAPMTAGAIISGSYFGDKMSPLSDTTNLAPAVAGSDLFTHIKHMVWTTGPSLIIALILYLILGFTLKTGMASSDISQFTTPIKSHFYISPILLIPPLVVILLVSFKQPALPSLFAGILLGMAMALIFQGESLKSVMQVAMDGYVSNTGSKNIDKLLSRGGMSAMMNTVALIISAVSFGGALEAGGFLQSITKAILKLIRGTGTLITATILTSIGVNILAGDQYISIVLPGKMYKATYKKFNLAPENLSRTLEDGGTLTSSLIPWNSGGAYMWTTLGVFPLAYLPFAFLNLINPLVAIFYGFTGIKITKLKSQAK